VDSCLTKLFIFDRSSIGRIALVVVGSLLWAAHVMASNSLPEATGLLSVQHRRGPALERSRAHYLRIAFAEPTHGYYFHRVALQGLHHVQECWSKTNLSGA